MLTRALFLAAGWFVISLAATLAWGIRLRKGNVLYSVGWLATVLLLGDLWATLTFGVPQEIGGLTLATFFFGLLWMGLIRKSALQEIGGWDEWCITEDAEASLRILKRATNHSTSRRATAGSCAMLSTLAGAWPCVPCTASSAWGGS